MMPASLPAHDPQEAARFLTLLDETADAFAFRVFDDNERRKDPSLAAKFTGTLDAVAPALLAKQAQGCGVYVVANAGAQTNDTIYKVRAVFADTDGADLGPILACGLEPHIVVESSPGKWHVYWLVDGLPTEAFRDIQRNIAARFGTDKSVNDLARVMRLPGFYHQKGAPFLVRIIHESGALPYSADVIREHFGAVGETAQAPASTPLGATVLADRHADVLKCTLLLAAAVRSGALTPEEALATMQQRRDQGRWSRHVPDDEIQRALNGALQKGGAPLLPPIEAPRPLAAVDLTNLLNAQLAPPPFVMAPYVPEGVVTLLGGHGGIGKSMLALTLAAHVAAGRPWAFTDVPAPGRTVFLSFEDSGEIVRYRLRRLLEQYELPTEPTFQNLAIFDGTEMEAELMRELPNGELVETPTLAEVEHACREARLIVIDNASDVYGGAENVRAQVRKFIRRLARIAKANQAGLILLVHIDKSAAKHGAQGNSYSGSTAWHNSARSRLALVQTESDTIELHQEKLNLGKKAEPLLLEHAEHGVLVPQGGSGTRAQVEADAGRADVMEVHRLMAEAARAGVVVPTSTAGAGQAHRVLETLPGAPRWVSGKDARRRIQTALLRLQDEGIVRRERYRKADRHFADRWVLASELPQEGSE